MYFFNQIIGKMPRSDAIYPETIDLNDSCYQCSKHCSDCLLGKLRIKDFNGEPHFPKRIKLISSQIQTNTLFKDNN